MKIDFCKFSCPEMDRVFVHVALSIYKQVGDYLNPYSPTDKIILNICLCIDDSCLDNLAKKDKTEVIDCTNRATSEFIIQASVPKKRR